MPTLHTAAPRYPSWFAVPNGFRETYPTRFPDFVPISGDGFKLVTSRRNPSIPFSQYQRVGVNVWDRPAFGNPPFYNYKADPYSWYTIPNGAAWAGYINSKIADGTIPNAAALSADSPTAGALSVINYLADNLEDLSSNLLLDQRQESGFDDTSPAYKRVAQRIAQRITAMMAANPGQYPTRPIHAGGYIFAANSDRTFWQAELNGSTTPDKRRPLRHEQYFIGDGWKNYNAYFQQERYLFMDQNAGTYWQGPHYTDGVYEMLNGAFVRYYAKTQTTSNPYNVRDILFIWDKCDNHEGSFSYSLEHETSNPAGRVRVKGRINAPVEWLRFSGWFAAVMKDGFAVWNDPVLPVDDVNWITDNVDNVLSQKFYPTGSTTPTTYTATVNGQQADVNTMVPEGMIDWAVLGFRQGYEIRRALGGKATQARFLDFKLDAGAYKLAKTNLSDVLYAADERRGLLMEFVGSNGMTVWAYFNAYGDHSYHTLTGRKGGVEREFTVLGNGLTYIQPFSIATT